MLKKLDYYFFKDQGTAQDKILFYGTLISSVLTTLLITLGGN